MNNFWRWMRKKQYLTKSEAKSKQMLIGYMIEYLQNEKCGMTHESNWIYSNIEDFYQQLENRINEVGRTEKKCNLENIGELIIEIKKKLLGK